MKQAATVVNGDATTMARAPMAFLVPAVAEPKGSKPALLTSTSDTRNHKQKGSRVRSRKDGTIARYDGGFG